MTQLSSPPSIKDRASWKRALRHAVPVSLFLLGLFYYWFAVADRYAIFLYGHLGATPFDARTSSRYWMAGLVASGAVLILYGAANWFFARLAGIRFRRYAPPPWLNVWLLCVPTVTVGIPALTLSLNQPPLRMVDAAACVLSTMAGLALALTPAQHAAQSLRELIQPHFAAVGLLPALLLLRAVELPAEGLATVSDARIIASGGLLVGGLWILFVTRFQRHFCFKQLSVHRSLSNSLSRQSLTPETDQDRTVGDGHEGLVSWRLHRSAALLVAACRIAYLLLPLAHYLYLTPPGFRYITISANFFALTPGMQLTIFLTTGLMAWGAAFLESRRGIFLQITFPTIKRSIVN